MDVLEHLIEEHRKTEQMLRQLSSSEEGAQREQLIIDLDEALSTHMAVEERFLYPIIEETIGSEEEEGAENEHDLARDGLTTLKEMADRPGFSAAVDMLQAGIKHHVEEEESSIFPKLRQKAQQQIDALGSPDEMEEAVKSSGGGSRSGGKTRDELYKEAQEADISGRSSMTKEQLEQALRRS